MLVVTFVAANAIRRIGKRWKTDGGEIAILVTISQITSRKKGFQVFKENCHAGFGLLHKPGDGAGAAPQPTVHQGKKNRTTFDWKTQKG